MSASGSTSSTWRRFDIASVTRPSRAISRSRIRSTDLSSTQTSACIPSAMIAAFRPTTPPPSTTTFAGGTPGTPPSRMPRPPRAFSSAQAPICGASRPATSLIGARSGRRRSAVSTVSYATPVTPESSSALVSGSSAAMWRYVKSVSPSRSRGYSGSIGSLTLSRSSADDQTSSTSASRAPTAAYASSAKPEPDPGAVLDDDLVAALDELERARGRQGDAVLLLLDLLRNPDPHGARDDTAPSPGDGVTGARGALRRTRRRRTTGPRRGRAPCARAAAAHRPPPSP